MSALVPDQARTPSNPHGAFPRKSQEWGQAATVADGMALTLIQMGKSRIPALDVDSSLPTVTAYSYQHSALEQVVRMLVPADRTASLMSWLLSGNSAFRYHSAEELKSL